MINRLIVWHTTELAMDILYSLQLGIQNSIIQLDWIQEYQWVDPPWLWEAVSGKGWIQKRSHFQLDSLFSPRPCTKVLGKKQDGSLLVLYPAFWLAQMDLLLYSVPLYGLQIRFMCSTMHYFRIPRLTQSMMAEYFMRSRSKYANIFTVIRD